MKIKTLTQFIGESDTGINYASGIESMCKKMHKESAKGLNDLRRLLCSYNTESKGKTEDYVDRGTLAKFSTNDFEIGSCSWKSGYILVSYKRNKDAHILFSVIEEDGTATSGVTLNSIIGVEVNRGKGETKDPRRTYSAKIYEDKVGLDLWPEYNNLETGVLTLEKERYRTNDNSDTSTISCDELTSLLEECSDSLGEFIESTTRKVESMLK